MLTLSGILRIPILLGAPGCLLWKKMSLIAPLRSRDWWRLRSCDWWTFCREKSHNDCTSRISIYLSFIYSGTEKIRSLPSFPFVVLKFHSHRISLSQECAWRTNVIQMSFQLATKYNNVTSLYNLRCLLFQQSVDLVLDPRFRVWRINVRCFLMDLRKGNQLALGQVEDFFSLETQDDSQFKRRKNSASNEKLAGDWSNRLTSCHGVRIRCDRETRMLIECRFGSGVWVRTDRSTHQTGHIVELVYEIEKLRDVVGDRGRVWILFLEMLLENVADPLHTFVYTGRNSG